MSRYDHKIETSLEGIACERIVIKRKEKERKSKRRQDTENKKLIKE